jgi:hypothetical protein
MDHGGGGGTDEATTTSLQHLNDDDMVAEILLRLPSVSVFRCRACVGHGLYVHRPSSKHRLLLLTNDDEGYG